MGRVARAGSEPSGPIHLLVKAKSIPLVYCLLFYPVLFSKPGATELPAKETIPIAHKSTIRKLFPRLKLKCFPSLVSCPGSQFPPCYNHQVSVSSQQLAVHVDACWGLHTPHQDPKGHRATSTPRIPVVGHFGNGVCSSNACKWLSQALGRQLCCGV